jgi:hypothetical protein
MKTGAELIAAERERQMSEEGWTPDHDDKHGNGSLAVAAACYAMPKRLFVLNEGAGVIQFNDPWPWSDGDSRKKQSNYPNFIPTHGQARLRMLVKAGALIAAEIDRLLRTEAGRAHAKAMQRRAA